MTQSMKDSVAKGVDYTGGLQSTSQSVGEAIAGNSDMRGGKSKKADDATSSLNELAGNLGKGGGTTPSTSVTGAQQVQNQQSGSADHLDLGFRKS